MIRTTALALLALLILTKGALAATYYVRTSGNDANNGLSAAAAFKTVTKGLATAQAGDTVYVGAGTYSAKLTPPRSGTATDPIRISGDTDGSRTGDAGTITLTASSSPVLSLSNVNYIQFANVTFSGTSKPIDLNLALYIVFDTCTITGGTGTMVIDAKNSSITMTGGSITSCTGDGITLTNNSTAALTGTTISSLSGAAVKVSHSNAILTFDRGTLKSNSGGGVIVSSGTATITNSIIRDMFTAVQTSGGTAQVWNNVLYNNTIGVRGSTGVATVKNNILSNCTVGIWGTVTTLTHTNNLYWSCAIPRAGVSSGTGDLSSNPAFLDTTNFRIDSTSPAVNAGTSAASVTTIDRDGMRRPAGGAWDIGPYEFGATAVSTVTLIGWSEIVPTPR